MNAAIGKRGESVRPSGHARGKRNGYAVQYHRHGLKTVPYADTTREDRHVGHALQGVPTGSLRAPRLTVVSPWFLPQNVDLNAELTRHAPRRFGVVVGEMRWQIWNRRRRTRRRSLHQPLVICRHQVERVLAHPIRMARPRELVAQLRVGRQTTHRSAKRVFLSQRIDSNGDGRRS